MIVVKLIQLGRENREYALENSSTVEDLFDAAEENFIQGNITRSHQIVSPETTLRDGDRIYIGTAVKGNQDIFDVNFLRFGDQGISLPAENGYTIKKTLEQLSDTDKEKFYRADGKLAYEFRIGNSGLPVGEDFVLNSPNLESIRIICTQRMKGNFYKLAA